MSLHCLRKHYIAIYMNIYYIIPFLFRFTCKSSKSLLVSSDVFHKSTTCINVGCRLTFSHRETRRRHINSGKCKGVPPQTVQHKVESFEKKDGNFICNKCKVVITHRNNIRRHLKSCMLKKGVKVKLQCTLCTAEFVCSKCDMVFQREYHMKKHVVKCEVFKPTMTGAYH